MYTQIHAKIFISIYMLLVYIVNLLIIDDAVNQARPQLSGRTTIIV